MINNPKISIVIPMYNVEKYIEYTLRSAMNQTLKDIEIIIVNDGSTDSSGLICKRLAEQDDRLVIYEKENGGASSARNCGMKRARGKYIYFLDADDCIESQTMEILYHICEDESLDFIIFSGTMKKSQNEFIYSRDKSAGQVTTSDELLYILLHNGEYNAQPCLYFFRYQYLIDNELSFREGIIREDELFSFQLYSAGSTHVKCISQRLFIQNVRSESVMNSSTNIKHFESIYVILQEIDKEYCNFKRNKKNIFRNLVILILLEAKRNYYLMNVEEQREQYYKLKKINQIQRQNKLKYSFKYSAYFIKLKMIQLLQAK